MSENHRFSDTGLKWVMLILIFYCISLSFPNKSSVILISYFLPYIRLYRKSNDCDNSVYPNVIYLFLVAMCTKEKLFSFLRKTKHVSAKLQKALKYTASKLLWLINTSAKIFCVWKILLIVQNLSTFQRVSPL